MSRNDELESLRAEVAALRRALCELALATSEDLATLSPTNALSRSVHKQAKVQRYFPTLAPMVAELMEDADTLQGSVARIAESMQRAHADAERGRVEGTRFDRHAGARREQMNERLRESQPRG